MVLGYYSSIIAYLQHSKKFSRKMVEASSASTHPGEEIEVFKKIEQYPWDSDEEYKQGLEVVLTQDTSWAQPLELTLKARCFYFSMQAWPKFESAEPSCSSFE